MDRGDARGCRVIGEGGKAEKRLSGYSYVRFQFSLKWREKSTLFHSINGLRIVLGRLVCSVRGSLRLELFAVTVSQVPIAYDLAAF
jgi:hypothetical protein